MKSEIVIVGAGISGTAIAYNLAIRGMKNIVVIDEGYLTAGSTGRCGAGVRQQWQTKANCTMAKKSIEFFEHAAETLQYDEDIEFKQEGYLILACTEAEVEQFEKNVALQNSLGIPSKVVSKEEALKIVPHLNPDAFLSATYCKTDGHLNPFKMTDAYYRAGKNLGVTYLFGEHVERIDVEQGKIQRVVTDKRTIETARVVDAAGGFAAEVGEFAGVKIPVYAERHEILVTEPIEKMQGPMVMSFSKNLYCQQVPHGAFIMGRTTPDEPHGHDLSSSWQFLDAMAKTVCHIMPKVGELHAIRQWAGSYCMSPDRQPILGPTDQLEGFYLACGFSGHGFMFAPMTGVLLAEMILGLPTTLPVEDLLIDRFKKQTATAYEKSVV
ncbi:MAG: FAD-dependent oxidoreductase [Tenericutes bacterium GWF2_57_13]|nr:MAG: FAD-dependent oxidoreductase [Tenericutes bacterium GWF2_57_13]